MTHESLARRLRVLRAALGITLAEAEELTGVTRETLGALEHGQRGAYTSTLHKIARGYGTTVSALLEEEKSETDLALAGSPKASAPQESGQPETAPPEEEPVLASPGKDDASDPALAALSPTELERAVLGAPVRGGEEPEPVIDAEEVLSMARQVRMERDAQERWLQEYLASPSSVRFAKRADAEAVKRDALLSHVYWLFLIDVWTKLADPRGVPFKGVLQLVSEADETFRALRDRVEERDRERRTEGRAG
jgi:transcriptional regulator with XRE-family HTH domain